MSRERRERIRKSKEIDALIRDSSIGDDAWVNCPRHGRTARDPYTEDCVECAHPVTMCLAHMEPEPCETCAAYIAGGL
jgi:hypothetical protein